MHDGRQRPPLQSPGPRAPRPCRPGLLEATPLPRRRARFHPGPGGRRGPRTIHSGCCRGDAGEGRPRGSEAPSGAVSRPSSSGQPISGQGASLKVYNEGPGSRGDRRRLSPSFPFCEAWSGVWEGRGRQRPVSWSLATSRGSAVDPVELSRSPGLGFLKPQVVGAKTRTQMVQPHTFHSPTLAQRSMVLRVREKEQSVECDEDFFMLKCFLTTSLTVMLAKIISRKK